MESNRTYKSSEAARVAATQYYIDKRGDAYRSHEERRRARRELQTRKASDKLARDVQGALELAYGVRVCSSCETHLPLNSEHYTPSKTSRHGMNTKCKACVAGYDSWEARRASQETRRQAKKDREASKQERERVRLVKGSNAWKEARRCKHKALEMLPLYTALSHACWNALANNGSLEALANELVEIAHAHNRIEFLEMNSEPFRMVREKRYEHLDVYEMARTWEALEDRWNSKAVKAVETMEELLAA